MKIKKYVLVGTIAGGVIGVLSTIYYFMCSAVSGGTFCEPVAIIPNLVWMIIKSNSTLELIFSPSDFFEFAAIILSYIFIGIILSLIYALLKGQNSKFEQPL